MNKPKKKRGRSAPEPIEEPPEEHEHGGAAKPVSLWPLDFETAIRGLIAVRIRGQE